MSFIATIEPNCAQGEINEFYTRLKNRRGKLAAVHQAQSLNINVLEQHMKLYESTMFADSPLSRAQREMLAVVVSAANNCHYCITHHSLALNHYWRSENRINLLQKQHFIECLDEKDRLLCQYAVALTTNPSAVNEHEYIEPMRQIGLSDREIVDAAGVIAYFNYVNRVVLGLGVKVETDGAGGYNY